MRVTVALSTAMLLVLLVAAAPVTAGPVDKDIGLITGTMTTSAALGMGIGPTTSSWSMAANVASVLHPIAGGLMAQGNIGPMGGIGANCFVSAGRDGAGSLGYADGLASLAHLGWDTSAGGVLIVTADSLGHVNGTLFALLRMEGGTPCLTATADTFSVTGPYTVI